MNICETCAEAAWVVFRAEFPEAGESHKFAFLEAYRMGWDEFRFLARSKAFDLYEDFNNAEKYGAEDDCGEGALG